MKCVGIWRLNFTTPKKSTEKILSNLEIPFFEPPRSTLGPLLDSEMVPESSKILPRSTPSTWDSGETAPGGPQCRIYCVYHAKRHPGVNALAHQSPLSPRAPDTLKESTFLIPAPPLAPARRPALRGRRIHLACGHWRRPRKSNRRYWSPLFGNLCFATPSWERASSVPNA